MFYFLNVVFNYQTSPEGSKKKKKSLSLSREQFFATTWTIVLQAPLSMEFSRQEYWSG